MLATVRIERAETDQLCGLWFYFGLKLLSLFSTLVIKLRSLFSTLVCNYGLCFLLWFVTPVSVFYFGFNSGLYFLLWFVTPGNETLPLPPGQWSGSYYKHKQLFDNARRLPVKVFIHSCRWCYSFYVWSTYYFFLYKSVFVKWPENLFLSHLRFSFNIFSFLQEK